MESDYALDLLIQKKDELQKYIDEVDDLDGLENWHNRTMAYIRSLDAAIASVRERRVAGGSLSESNG